jgi:Tol biopolymer transport system component
MKTPARRFNSPAVRGGAIPGQGPKACLPQGGAILSAPFCIKAVRAFRSPQAIRGWCWALLPALVVALAAQALGEPLQLGSVLAPTSPPAAAGGGDSYGPILSPDGRYVLFASTANNLVLNSNLQPFPNLLPLRLNVFLRDRTNQTTTLVSVNLAGAGGGDGDSLPAGISTNGRFALFESSAANLVPGDTNQVADIFLRDLVAGTTALVSVNTNGMAARGASRGSVITPDGRYAAFASEASDLVAGDTNGIADVFLRDLQAGTTTLVSLGARASGTSNGSESPVITPDGRYVAFYSAATNLVAGEVNSGDIYLRDVAGGLTTWVSSYALTAQHLAGGTNPVVACDPVLSADGQFVAYQANPAPKYGTPSGGVVLRYSVASGFTDVIHTNAPVPTGPFEDTRCLDMTPDGRFVAFLANTNGSPGANSCMLVWDAQTATTVLASGDVNGSVPGNSTCGSPSLDGTGRYVVFLSCGSNLVTNAVAADYHVYLRDLQAGTTTLVSADSAGFGPGLNAASLPRMTPDARYVAWEGLDSNLVPNERNHTYNVFVRDLAAGTNDLVSARHPTLPTLSANGPSQLSAASVSADGTYVAFASDADNLVPGHNNGFRDVFVLNLPAGTNCLVSSGTNGAGANGPSTDSAISGDGRYVAFTSTADNLVAGDTNKAQDVFVRDLQTGTTTLVSLNFSGTGPGNGASYSPIISTDGRFVLFQSLAKDLTAGSFSGSRPNLFLRDLQLATNYALTLGGLTVAAMTPDGRFVAFSGDPVGGSDHHLFLWDLLAAKRVYGPVGYYPTSVGVSPSASRIAFLTNNASGISTLAVIDRVAGTSWTIGPGSALSHPGLRFSGDGRWLVYAGPLSGTNQVYLYDAQYRTNFLVSHKYAAAAGGYGASDWPELSSDGRFVAYRSLAADLVPGTLSGQPQLFLYDHANNSTLLLSADRLGTAPGDNRSLAPVFSADAQMLLFASWASDLVAQDFNQSSDFFAYRLAASGQIPVFTVTLGRGTGSGNGAWLSWPVIPGRAYQAQFKSSLSDPGWQTLNQDVTVVGAQGYLNDVTAGAGPRFYRIVAY